MNLENLTNEELYRYLKYNPSRSLTYVENILVERLINTNEKDEIANELYDLQKEYDEINSKIEDAIRILND